MPSPDGRYLSFLDRATGDLAVWEIATGKQRRLTANPPESGQFSYFSAISPDSHQVAYAWFNDEKFYDLRVASIEGGPPRTLHRNPETGFVQPCAWSPDGKQILTLFFRKDNVSQIALVSARDGSVNILKTLSWFYPKKMGFSPDGKYIVYDSILSRDSEARDIFVLRTDGSGEFKLVEHEANDIFPLWSPGGETLIFASDRAGSMDIWAQPVLEGKSHGEPKRLMKSPGRLLPMGITRDGSYYFGLRTGGANVYVARLQGERGELAGEPELAGRKILGGNVAPEWSPDGQRLGYLSRLGTENYGQESRAITIWTPETGVEWAPNGDSLYVSTPGKTAPALWLVSLHGGTPKKLPVELQRDGGIRLHPDGRSFAYTLNEERNEVWVVQGPARASTLRFSPEPTR